MNTLFGRERRSQTAYQHPRSGVYSTNLNQIEKMREVGKQHVFGIKESEKAIIEYCSSEEQEAEGEPVGDMLRLESLLELATDRESMLLQVIGAYMLRKGATWQKP